MQTPITSALRQYVEEQIIPQYDHFDKAHQRDHVLMVISQSLELAQHLDVCPDMVYAIAAYHDTGLCEGREHHHEVSARIIKADKQLRQWFSEEEIEVMAQAAEDHRASSSHAPRTIYGRIVAEADRFIDPETIVQRTIQYGLDHYPEMNRQAHFQRMMEHLHEKYGRNGYLHLWFENSPNTTRLNALRDMMEDEATMETLFNRFYQGASQE
ncbi:MAG: HD domain-containing protein [Bacteroidales bacterium]|nr:HD domain-containing protein [Bacteroidales bacterium]